MQTVRLAMDSNHTGVLVDAEIIGPMAVHESVETGDSWAVSHLFTGIRMEKCRWMSYDEAVSLAHAIWENMNCYFGWEDMADPEFMKARKQELIDAGLLNRMLDR